MKIDWLTKLAFLLQTLAFCLMVATIQYAIRPERSYELPVVYSLCIGTCMWALVDFGRHAFPSARETGWPEGLAGWLLPLGGIVGGFLLGTLLGTCVRARSWEPPSSSLQQPVWPPPTISTRAARLSIWNSRWHRRAASPRKPA
jgi:hypothetical protein